MSVGHKCRAWLVRGVSVGIVLCGLVAPAHAGTPDDETVALVDGEAITFAELDHWLEEHAASERRRLVQAQEDLRRRALDAVLQDRLLAAESRRQQRSVDEVRVRLAARFQEAVRETDIEAFISANALSPDTDTAAVRASVRTLLERQSRERAEAQAMQALREQAGSRVEVRREPSRVRVTGAPYSPRVGAEAAPVQVVVFSDFECPYCRRAAPVLRRVAAAFPNDVSLIWRHFPLGIHPSAPRAAEAAQCAEDQGRFWEFHDALFSQSASLADVSMAAVARTLGLDAESFEACLGTRKHQADVASDIAAGEMLGVAGTPTTFVNGIALVGALPFEAYERTILAERVRLKAVAVTHTGQGGEGR